jgi:hypothetical protein
MQDLWTIVFGTAVGFTVAGLVASGFDILGQRRLGFALDGAGSTPELLLGMLLRIVAGPFLIARNVVESLRKGDANPIAVAVLISAACMWGCLSGVIVLDLLGGVAPSAAAGR